MKNTKHVLLAVVGLFCAVFLVMCSVPAPENSREPYLAQVSSAQCSNTTYEAESVTQSTRQPTSPTGGWNLHGNGHVRTTTGHAFTAEQTTITVTARGQSAAGEWPHMVVRVGSTNGSGGTVVGDTFVTSGTYTQYAFTFMASAGSQEISIHFDNDFSQGAEDRNLYLDKFVVSCSSSSECPLATYQVETLNSTGWNGESTSGAWNSFRADATSCLPPWNARRKPTSRHRKRATNTSGCAGSCCQMTSSARVEPS